MLLSRLVTLVHRNGHATPRGVASRAVVPRLPDRAAMERILARERDRADRTGDAFSLVTFAPHESDGAGELLERIARFLRRRLRLTDDFGWIEEGVLGAVLPHTSARGAWKLANEVCLAMLGDGPAPACAVYTYPSDREAERLIERRARRRRLRRARGARPGRAQRVPPRRPERTQPVRAMETLFLRRTPRWKRAIDVVGAGVALACLFPLLALVAAAVKLSSRGPLFFRQFRSGLGGRPFTMYKFRSMVVDAEAQKQGLMALNEQDGPAFKIRSDPRVTALGRLLRITSIDELPQLWNVLRGEMSLVGPRPLPCDETARCAPWQRRRLDVVPGLTCFWQVEGRSRVTFDQWARMDIRYVRTRSLLGDLKLLLKTVPALIFCRGS